MTGGEPVVASVHIEAPPEKVFAFFVEPDKLCAWLARSAELEPRPGGRLVLDIEGTPVRGEVLEVDPGRRLLWSWGHAGSDRLPPRSSRVEILLTAEDGGTRVQLIHHGLPESEVPSHVRGWKLLLTRLAAVDVA
jgi:uncharacterized protein YndB with AHSA1/START domain